MTEEWRQVEGFEDQYEVSDLGQVRNSITRRIRKTQLNHQGFPTLVLYNTPNPSRYIRQVNKLVATAFCEPPTYRNMNSVWHIDGDLLNCRAENLRWERRDLTLEWNEMHRSGHPRYKTPRVVLNRTGEIFDSAYEVALLEGVVESYVIGHIERYPDDYSGEAKYRYV